MHVLVVRREGTEERERGATETDPEAETGSFGGIGRCQGRFALFLCWLCAQHMIGDEMGQGCWKG